MNVSVTQVGNYTAFIPVVILLLGQFDIKVTESELTNLIASVFAIVGIITSIYGRYRQGDVSLLGIKTNPNDQR